MSCSNAAQESGEISLSLCVQGLTNKECMLCVLTAFEILSGQGAVV